MVLPSTCNAAQPWCSCSLLPQVASRGSSSLRSISISGWLLVGSAYNIALAVTVAAVTLLRNMDWFQLCLQRGLHHLKQPEGCIHFHVQRRAGAHFGNPLSSCRALRHAQGSESARTAPSPGAGAQGGAALLGWSSSSLQRLLWRGVCRCQTRCRNEGPPPRRACSSYRAQQRSSRGCNR